MNELTHTVEIRGESGRSAKERLAIFSFGFIEELFEPLPDHLILKMIRDKHLGSHVILNFHQITDGSVIISGILVEILAGVHFFTIDDTADKFADIDASTGDRKKTDRGDNRITAADVIRDDKGLVTDLIRFKLQRSADAISGCNHCIFQLFFSKLLHKKLF